LCGHRCTQHQKKHRFFEKLDAITIRHNGIINLSKDSRITAELARQVFGGYDNFKQRIQAYDPEKLFRSDLRTKLGI
jgi:FAD/FMN-containing dehydrogenase